MIRLSKKAFTAIKKNPELYSKVCTQLNVSVFTLVDKMRRNDPAFTQIGVINLIKKYTGFTDDEILIDSDIESKVMA